MHMHRHVYIYTYTCMHVYSCVYGVASKFFHRSPIHAANRIIVHLHANIMHSPWSKLRSIILICISIDRSVTGIQPIPALDRHASTYMKSLSANFSNCMYACTYVCVYIYEHDDLYVGVHVYTHVHIHIFAYVIIWMDTCIARWMRTFWRWNDSPSNNI